MPPQWEHRTRGTGGPPGEEEVACVSQWQQEHWYLRPQENTITTIFMVCFCSIVLLLTFVKSLIYFCYFSIFTLHFIVYVLSAFVFPFFWFFKIFLLFCVFVLYFFFQFGFFFWIFASFLFNYIILFSGSLIVLLFYAFIFVSFLCVSSFFFFLLLLSPFVLVYSSIHLFLFFFGHPVWFQGLFFSQPGVRPEPL